MEPRNRIRGRDKIDRNWKLGVGMSQWSPETGFGEGTAFWTRAPNPSECLNGAPKQDSGKVLDAIAKIPWFDGSQWSPETGFGEGARRYRQDPLV